MGLRAKGPLTRDHGVGSMPTLCLLKWAGCIQVFLEFMQGGAGHHTGVPFCFTPITLSHFRCLQAVMRGGAAQAGAAKHCAGGCAQLACAARAAPLLPGMAVCVL